MPETADSITAVHQRLADLKRGESQSAQGVQVSASWVIETVEMLLLEIERLRAGSVSMTPADYLFIAAVLETPLGDYGFEGAVQNARRRIEKRYDELKATLSFEAASRQARAEWLREFVEGIRTS